MTDTVVGQADLHPHLFGHSLKVGDTVYQHVQGERRSSGSVGSSACMRTSQESIEEVLAGDIAAVVGLEDRRPATRCATAGIPSSSRLSSFRRPSSRSASYRRPRWTTSGWARCSTALRTRTRPSRCRLRPGNARDDHLGHGRASSRDHRRPSEARIQRWGQGRPSRGRLPRDRDRALRGRVQAHQADGGRGQYAHVEIGLEPTKKGEGFEFVDAVVGGRIPSEFIPAVQKGVVRAMLTGPYAGYPVVDMRVTLVDGSYHDVDSSLRFRLHEAGRWPGSSKLFHRRARQPRGGHVAGGGDAGGIHGLGHGLHLLPARTCIESMDRRGPPQGDHPRHGAALGDVRLLHACVR